MFHPKDQRIMNIIELLEQENLFPADEITLIEDYLCGEAGDEVLEKIPARDLSGMGVSAKIYSQYIELSNKGKLEEAARLGKLLFALGQASGYRMFPMICFNGRNKEILTLEPAKKTSVYASVMAANEYQLRQSSFENLIETAGHKADTLRQALEYQNGAEKGGRVFLLTAYFNVKYPAGKPKAEEGILAGLGKLFGKGQNSSGAAQLEEGDAALMKEYEEILIRSIPRLYQGVIAPKELDEIMEAVSEDRVDERIRNLACAKTAADRHMLRMLAGTAFANYELSAPLRNVVSICLSADAGTALDAIDNMDLRGSMKKNASSFDVIFGVDSRKFIGWAAKKMRADILREQIGRNPETFVECMDSADFNTYNMMARIVKELAPELYRARQSQEAVRQQGKVIEAFLKVVDARAGNDVRQYLSGDGDINLVYACKDTLNGTYWWGGRVIPTLKSYQAAYGYDAFSNRCETLLLAGNGCTTYLCFLKDGKVDEKEVRRFFAAVDSEGLNLETQLSGFVALAETGWQTSTEDAAEGVFLDYLEKRPEEMLQAFRNASSGGRRYGLRLMAKDAEKYKADILSYSQDSAKAVREALMEILYQQKGWEAEVTALLSSKKAADRETAIRVMDKWQREDEAKKAPQAGKTDAADASGESGGKYAVLLTQALEKEKNGKVKALLESALRIEGAGAGGKTITQGDLVKEMHKGGKKRTLAWAYETPFSVVHKKDGTEAEEAYLQAIFLCYSTMPVCGVNSGAAELAGALDEREFAVYVGELFDKWMAAGAEAKKRWVLYASAIHGGTEMVAKLHHQIQEWPQAARGAIASDAVQALALSPQPQALLIVDGISRKFKFKQVKAAAGKALEFAASQLGITTEELADRIVPNLGFDENMKRIFDYGERKFTVTITTALEIEVYDESGKKLKNLPAPGKRDDAEKAAAAYEEFKQMKKQMKTTVSSQKMRLEMALSTERQWSVQAWKELFVKNPIMHQFAIGLIWGVYEDRKLVSSFRYMEDGSFNTEDEEEFELPRDSRTDQAEGGSRPADGSQNAAESSLSIGLVHPIELSEDSIKAWKEQLEDYEITQPIEQLDRPVYYRTVEENGQKTLERFAGCILNDLSLGGKLMSQGWYKGSVEDGGGFYTYYRTDPELSLAVVLWFSGSWVGGENDDVTVYETRFYKAGEQVTWSYDKKVDDKAYFLGEIPDRYFSEIVLQISKAVASSKERNENWKSNSR